jgi:hypothetical protein|nr:MAG TPA: hypothetical protein [Caudoviricetes sp.]
MTREEAVETLENHTQYFVPVQDLGALNMAIAALRPVSREQLSEFKTCDLVDELRKREGVETHIAEPYQDVTVSVNGPAVVLVVID